MVGVNGAGKTTTIGKLARQWTAAGKTVVLAAGRRGAWTVRPVMGSFEFVRRTTEVRQWL